ncbi:DUF4331 family protein [Microbulbifer sp. 2304DJ12-6]|uniref:DUF4331 family protein n=1 Tax=Microbulbifer sp. 2304DJ12-6 TaxID=3233340 RepID=UPI0039AF5CE0
MLKLFILTMLVFSFNSAFSSHHWETELANKYPQYNLGDAYVFKSASPGHTTFILTGNPPPIGKGGDAQNLTNATSFGDNGLYSFHISKNKKMSEGFTLNFKFNGPSFDVGILDEPNGKIGMFGRKLLSGKVGETIQTKSGIKIWAARTLEPYFVDAFDFGAFQKNIMDGNFDKQVFKKHYRQDIFKDSRISSIVIDIPNKLLGENVYFYGSSSMKVMGGHDEWMQITRVANVLMQYIFLYNTHPSGVVLDQTRPDTDHKLTSSISNNVFRAVSEAGGVGGGVKAISEYANRVADMLTPDVLKFKIGSEGDYKIGGDSGRPLYGDSSNEVFKVYTGVVVDDFISNPKKYTSKFPYLIPVNK